VRDFVILDMRRMQTVDVTAVHMLEQVKDMLAERNGFPDLQRQFRRPCLRDAI
jgi:hypothetical protein